MDGRKESDGRKLECDREGDGRKEGEGSKEDDGRTEGRRAMREEEGEGRIKRGREEGKKVMGGGK